MNNNKIEEQDFLVFFLLIVFEFSEILVTTKSIECELAQNEGERSEKE